MNQSRLEWKVGVFVFAGLALLGGLLLQFSKGTTFFRSTYDLSMHCSNSGGLKPRAQILMAGVQVGSVAGIQLTPDGRSVTVALRIYGDYRIYPDAAFNLEQSGFLGDLYVAITPKNNEGSPLKNGDSVRAQDPFNLQEFVRTSGGSVKELQELMRKLRDAINNINEYALNQQNYSNIAATLSNLQLLSSNANRALDRIDSLVATNEPAVTTFLGNLAAFSSEATNAVVTLNHLVEGNRDSIGRSVTNVEASTRTLKGLMEDVESGKGPLGILLKDDRFAASLADTAYNLSVTSSNLNRLGLWGILWKHRASATNAPGTLQLTAPKNPFDN